MKGLTVTKSVKGSGFDEGLGRVTSEKLFQGTIILKVSKTNSSFLVKQRLTVRVQFSIFQEFLAIIEKRTHFVRENFIILASFNIFLIFANFLKSSLNSFGNSCGISCYHVYY